MFALRAAMERLPICSHRTTSRIDTRSSFARFMQGRMAIDVVKSLMQEGALDSGDTIAEKAFKSFPQTSGHVHLTAEPKNGTDTEMRCLGQGRRIASCSRDRHDGSKCVEADGGRNLARSSLAL